MARHLSLIEQAAFTMNSPYHLDADRARNRILGVARAFEWWTIHDLSDDGDDRHRAIDAIRHALALRREDDLDEALEMGGWK